MANGEDNFNKIESIYVHPVTIGADMCIAQINDYLVENGMEV